MKRPGLLLALPLLAGCAVLTHPSPHHPPMHLAGAIAGARLADGYEDHPGVIHIHTTYSHDAQGRFEDAIRVANAQGLDFLIFTEHNNLRALREGRQGWYGTVLALIGMEISTRAGHYVSMNVTQEMDREHMTAQQVIDEVNRQGGLGFIAHPYFKKARWSDWTVTGFTGVEGYNVAHDTLDENKLRLALWTLGAPVGPFYYSLIDRPYDPLAKWDELIRGHGRVTGIGSADAHEFHMAGLKFAPYEVMFQLIRTHVLTPPGRLTDQAIYDALRKGHAYFAIELLAEAKGFQFVAETDTRLVGVMGDDVPLQPALRLTASLPAPAQLVLFKDGQAIQSVTAQTWQVPVTAPGAYRLEASRHGKPWIFSNPIYVRPSLDSPSG